jgi:hypothetical protein
MRRQRGGVRRRRGEEKMRQRRGCNICARGGDGYRKSCCCAEQRRFREDPFARHYSVARRATFDNWRLAVEQGSQIAWSVTMGVVS